MKKILEHLKENWIRHGFETMVVVAGVLIAFSLNSWNESMKDRKKEFILLRQLEADFETNQSLIMTGLERQKLDKRVFKLILNHTGPDVEMPDPDIRDSLEDLNYTIVDLVYTTINPNITVDQFIKSNELNYMLSSFPGIFSKYKDFENVTRELTLKARTIHQRHVAILSMDPTMQTNGQTPHSSDYLGWLRDRDYQNLVVDLRYQLENANNTLLDLQKTNEKILNLINQELSRFD
jgi:hypothetical protein